MPTRRETIDVDGILARLFTPEVDPRGIDGGERPFVEQTAEQKLLFAMLVDGLTRAARGTIEARQWVASAYDHWGTFLYVTEALGLSSKRLRCALWEGILGRRFHFLAERRVERGRARAVRTRRRKHKEAA